MRYITFFLISALVLASTPAWTAVSPGGEQTESTKDNNTAVIVAVSAIGVAMIGGLLWWHLRQPSVSGEGPIIRKPQGKVPFLLVGEFKDENPAAQQTHLSKKVRSLLWDALKRSQAFSLCDFVPPDLPLDSIAGLSCKVTALTSFSQAEVSVSQTGKTLFLQTVTWFEDRELKKQIIGLVNMMTEKVQ